MDRVTLPGTLDSLAAIGDLVLRAADAAGLDQKASYRLRLAVDEVATNIVIHGYEEPGLQGGIAFWYDLDGRDLCVTLEDTAGPFDPLQAQPPSSMDLPLDERPIGGLGLFLALRGVDELHYERLGDRNRNTFVMHRPAAPNR